MAVTILVVAVNKAGVESSPFKVYQNKDNALKGLFTLKVSDAGVNDNGSAQTKLNNFSLGLITTNGAEYIDEKLSGFRRKVGDGVFIQCKKYTEDMATSKEMADAEEEF